MKYTVYQINLTKEQIDQVNTLDSYPEFYKKYMAVTFKPSAADVKAAYDMYNKVAEITAYDLNDLFMIGNIFEGFEDQINRLAPMRSVSVGDIIVDENDRAVFVSPIGFTPVQL